MAEKGKLIVFEGLDGSGKTTQRAMLSEKLTALAIPHICTCEPTRSNRVGQLAREAIEGKFQLENEALALLFAADRVQHAAEEMIPALQAGRHVLCDRFFYSNFAYQGAATPLERLIQYNGYILQTLTPDITFFLDVEPEECLKRIQTGRTARADIYENAETLRRVRAQYMKAFTVLAATQPVVPINARGLTAEQVADQIWARAGIR